MDPLRDGYLDHPLSHRLPLGDTVRERIMEAHRRAVDSGLSTYRDPGTGLMVMTAGYLAERGYCCSSGCRHCPYESGGYARRT